MAGRGAALADQFEKSLGELTQTIQSMPDDKWQGQCEEGWTVAAVAQHVAAQFPLEKTYISAAAEGTPPPQHSMDDINKANESRAKDVSAIGKADVLRQLRDGGAAMASYVRGLSDEQLARTAPLALAGGADVSAEQLIQGGVLIDHVNAHLKSIQAAG
jgi:DinB family protein